MDAKKLLSHLRNHMTVDQEFYHHMFMDKAKKIEKKEDLVEIIDLLHSNYLIRTKLFSALAKHVAMQGYELPSLSDLLKGK